MKRWIHDLSWAIGLAAIAVSFILPQETLQEQNFVCGLQPAVQLQQVQEADHICGLEPAVEMQIQATKRITWSTQRGGHVAEITYEQQVEKMRRAFSWLEMVCNVDCVQVDSGGMLRYSYKDNEGMAIWVTDPATGKKKKMYALGLSHSGGRIDINNERKIDARNPKRFIVEVLTLHEAFHSNRTMGWNHSTNPDCIIHIGSGTNWFCKREVELLQQKYGVPKATWYPHDRGVVGTRINEIIKQRKIHIANRDGSTDKKYRTEQQNANLKLLQEQIRLSKEWFRLNNYWRGVPKAHTAKYIFNKELRFNQRYSLAA